MARATVQEVTQIGVETTPGTAVTTNRRLDAVSINLKEAAAFDEFAPMGGMLNTIVALRQNWATFDLNGYPCYQALYWLLAGLIGAPVTTTPGGGTNSRQHVFTLSQTGVDTLKTYTIEKGVSGGTVEKAAYGVVTDMKLGFSRSAAQTMDGSGFARQLDYAATLDAAGTIGAVPILASQVNVYADDTGAGIGTTKLLSDFSAEFNLTGRRNPLWVLNTANASFKEDIIARPDASLSLELGNDAVSRALVTTTMRGSATKFIRIEAIGAIIEGAIPYKLWIDAACKVNSAPSAGDVDGASTLPMGFRVVNDSTWAKGLEVTLVNTQVAL